jgi:hypothetical protein
MMQYNQHLHSNQQTAMAIQQNIKLYSRSTLEKNTVLNKNKGTTVRILPGIDEY